MDDLGQSRGVLGVLLRCSYALLSLTGLGLAWLSPGLGKGSLPDKVGRRMEHAFDGPFPTK